MPARFIIKKFAFPRLWLACVLLCLGKPASELLASEWLQSVSPLAYYRNFSNPTLVTLQTANPSGLYEKDTTDNSYYALFFDGEDGNLHRAFDPQSKADQSYTAGGSKHLGKRNLFSGSFNYHRQTLYEKKWVHNSNPYAALPFLLADSSVGDFRLNGLYWEITYARVWVPGKLLSGTTLFYNVDEEYKSVFPKPQVNHRDIVLTQGFQYQIGGRSRLGLTALYFDFQENMKTSQYNQDQTKTPIFYKIRGLDNPLIFKGETSEERLMATQGYQIKSDGELSPLNFFQFNWIAGLEKSQCQNTDGGAYPVAQGKWRSHTEFFNAALDLRLNSYLSVSLFTEGIRRAGSARHPNIDMQIYSARHQQLAIGVKPRLTGKVFTYGGQYTYLSQTYRQTDTYNGILHYYPSDVQRAALYLMTSGSRNCDAGIECGYDRLIVGDNRYFIERADWFYTLITQADAAYYTESKSQIWSQVHISFQPGKSQRYSFFCQYGLLQGDGSSNSTAWRAYLTVRLVLTNY